MSNSIEIEKTFLCPAIPIQYISGKPLQMIDVYLPETSEHPKLRIRQKGDKYEITKKTPIDNDPSRQIEENINLTKNEFDTLVSTSSRKIEKWRLPLTYEGFEGELDVFFGEHTGLVLVDFEFLNVNDQEKFGKPIFCSDDVTMEDSIAGGVLSGLKNEDLFKILREKYNYLPADISDFRKTYSQ